mmetsp:Transcript_7684/g.13223  ORF Transcript_7684/g.13223 Transcript_7684/m.13223 type:complete len:124 (+) Transcript_7684:333-704(+)|eukprot:CAMPEP_0198199982 /NCGR_PEP_ID=MMETSP1445-20131203/3065_1 /TAXON_ID=36898 /ORGANISM="Pyramimonas sp., Strain CCMP2087" /LENGTH=123 /DNA_ID=CAMNT_0043869899 /DNA_START=274 /DNA_END=645 /DNA_ORIENTATION=+
MSVSSSAVRMKQQVMVALAHGFNQLSVYIKRIANQPSLGLYYIQKHVRKAYPQLLGTKKRVEEANIAIDKRRLDAEESRVATCTMNTHGTEAISRMQDSMARAMDALSHIQEQRKKEPALTPD